MRSYSSSKKKKRSDLASHQTRWIWIATSVAALLLVGGWGLSFTPLRTYGKQLEATNGAFDGGLLYLQSDSHGPPKVVHRPRDSQGRLSLDVDQSSTLASPRIPAGCEALGMYAPPRGPWLAIDVTCEASGFVQVINVASGKAVDLDAHLSYDSTFVNWSPTGNEIILRAGNLPNSRIYLIQVNSGKYQQLPVPGNVYDIALSTDGRRMIYSLTQGLGYGSETWIADVDGQNAQRVLLEPRHIIAFARWSPSGEAIAYIRMLDSNIPFTVGELWVMGGDGQNPILLGNADAGHGYRPAWSPDGQQIAFVVRELVSDSTDIESEVASYVAGQLVSNIYLANLNNKSIISATKFNDALTETPVWSQEGDYLAFGSTAGGSGMDVWVLDTRNSQLYQVTHGMKARYPAWLSNP